MDDNLKTLWPVLLMFTTGAGLLIPSVRRKPALLLLLGGSFLAGWAVIIRDGKLIQEQIESYDEIEYLLYSLKTTLSKSVGDVDMSKVEQRATNSHPRHVNANQWIYSPRVTDRRQAEVEKHLREYKQIGSKCSDLKSRLSEEKIEGQFTVYVEQSIKTAINYVEKDGIIYSEEVDEIYQKLDLASIHLDLIMLNKNYINHPDTQIKFSPLLSEIHHGKIRETEQVSKVYQTGMEYLTLVKCDREICLENARDALRTAINNPSSQTIEVASKEVKSLETLRDHARAIEQFCRETDENRVDLDFSELKKRKQEATEAGDPQLIEGLAEKAETLARSQWKWEDLYAYNWRSFEKLVADYFRAKGYSASITRSGSDRGIDVIAESKTERIAIQIKHYKPENKVGRPTVQKTAAMLAANQATKVIILTSSQFTDPAVKEAHQYNGQVKLVNGQEFANLLSDTSIPIPD